MLALHDPTRMCHCATDLSIWVEAYNTTASCRAFVHQGNVSRSRCARNVEQRRRRQRSTGTDTTKAVLTCAAACARGLNRGSMPAGGPLCDSPRSITRHAPGASHDCSVAVLHRLMRLCGGFKSATDRCCLTLRCSPRQLSNRECLARVESFGLMVATRTVPTTTDRELILRSALAAKRLFAMRRSAKTAVRTNRARSSSATKLAETASLGTARRASVSGAVVNMSPAARPSRSGRRRRRQRHLAPVGQPRSTFAAAPRVR